MSRQVNAVQEAFAEKENETLAFVTIILGLTSWTEDIGDIFLRARRKLRNIVDENRRSNARWRRLQVVGWLEVDAFDPHRFVDLPPNKKEQLEAIGLPFVGAGPTWVVTLHALVSLDGVDRYRLAEELRRRWDAPTQVDVRPFDTTRSADQNINSLVRYCLKNRTTTATTVCHAEPWDISWSTEYYEYLNKWSRGFQSTRIWIKPQNDSRKSSQCNLNTGASSGRGEAEYAKDNEVGQELEDDAMPFIF
jgi:hypothetical protein